MYILRIIWKQILCISFVSWTLIKFRLPLSPLDDRKARRKRYKIRERDTNAGIPLFLRHSSMSRIVPLRKALL